MGPTVTLKANIYDITSIATVDGLGLLKVKAYGAQVREK